VVKTFINIIASKDYKYIPWMKKHQHWMPLIDVLEQHLHTSTSSQYANAK
jgi:hypothetical protein